ncbi:MAG TPA: 3'-5' exonuclease [Bacteroidales bacterium]|nr:3'-5' exonuclease [Bacteroidales bacterium]
MNLNLKKPIVFFDLETTGVDVANDRIVEISLLKILPNGKEETKTMRVNPGIPIPPQVTEIHGISDKDVEDKPKFNELAKTIANYLEGCDIAGYNSNKFDIPLLAEEFLRADIDFDLKKLRFIDVQVIFHKMEQRTLSAAYKFYCEKDLDNAHSAEADTKATYEILKAQIDRYSELNNDMEELSKFSSHNNNADFAGRIVFDDNGNEVFNFGKYKGQKVETVLEKDPGYFSWMLNSDFPLYTKKVLTAIKLRKFNS